MQNWCPISLPATDVKMLTKCIANKVFSILPLITSEDQTGFIKECYKGENIRLIDDLLDCSKHENKEVLLLQLDFEKAFDSIEWSFYIKLLMSSTSGQTSPPG